MNVHGMSGLLHHVMQVFGVHKGARGSVVTCELDEQRTQNRAKSFLESRHKSCYNKEDLTHPIDKLLIELLPIVCQALQIVDQRSRL
jgi:hypothetical protein